MTTRKPDHNKMVLAVLHQIGIKANYQRGKPECFFSYENKIPGFSQRTQVHIKRHQGLNLVIQV